MTFQPITRNTVSAQIREQLLRMITTGELSPGARVPSERELSEEFEVARTSVREAIQGLLSMGLVERRGNRTWVAEHLPDVAVDSDSSTEVFVHQLFETRRVLEVPVFALAAGRSDDGSREAVRAVVQRFEGALTLCEFRQLDREFHTLIASGCGNPLLLELYSKVLDQLFRSWEIDSILTEQREQHEVDEIIRAAVEGHEVIANAYCAGDPVAMASAVEAHLIEIENSMVPPVVS
ncbi:MAG: FadR family transcriptional regulator [Ilumatobacteraceae bacterium]|nr:FadR family transcriptional regulator [Ilumatobacteraceae bacterium]